MEYDQSHEDAKNMKDSYKTAIDLIFRHEGGYVNNPRDPGGETKYGISKRAFPELDIAALTKPEAAKIYRVAYWHKIKGDDLPVGIDLEVFDMAVNAGPGRAVRILQRCIGVDRDGIIGPATLKAVGAASDLGDCPYSNLIHCYHAGRMRHYQGLSTWSHFGRGWTRRAEETRDVAVSLDRSSEQSSESNPSDMSPTNIYVSNQLNKIKKDIADLVEYIKP